MTARRGFISRAIRTLNPNRFLVGVRMRTRPRLSPAQIWKLWCALIDEERAAAAERMARRPKRGKLPTHGRAEAGRVRDRIGELAGISGRNVEKCIHVYRAFEDDPELYGPAKAYLDASENYQQAHKMMHRLCDEARVKGLAPIPGKFATLVLDPPWRDDSVSVNQRPAYATMTLTEIAALPVPGWAMPECHLYLWVPNNLLLAAGALLGPWGFDYKTVLTWRKPRWGTGRYFRNDTEQVLFATRGGLMTRSDAIASSFDGPVAEHSAKPDVFYDLVRAASHGPYGEGFQRQARPGFTNLYTPIGAASALEAAA